MAIRQLIMAVCLVGLLAGVTAQGPHAQQVAKHPILFQYDLRSVQVMDDPNGDSVWALSQVYFDDQPLTYPDYRAAESVLVVRSLNSGQVRHWLDGRPEGTEIVLDLGPNPANSLPNPEMDKFEAYCKVRGIAIGGLPTT